MCSSCSARATPVATDANGLFNDRIQRSRARDTEQLRAAAGFRLQLADTAEQQQQLAATPAYRLVRRAKGDGVEDTYAVTVSHPTRAVLHPATRGRLLDTAPVPADRGADRAPHT
jgi:hypothetical protein